SICVWVPAGYPTHSWHGYPWVDPKNSWVPAGPRRNSVGTCGSPRKICEYPRIPKNFLRIPTNTHDFSLGIHEYPPNFTRSPRIPKLNSSLNRPDDYYRRLLQTLRK